MKKVGIADMTYRQNATGLGIKESDFHADLTVNKFDQWWDDNGGVGKNS